MSFDLLTAPRPASSSMNDTVVLDRLLSRAGTRGMQAGIQGGEARPSGLDRLRAGAYRELDVAFNEETGICWCHFSYAGRPCFSPTLLDDIRAVQAAVCEAADAGAAAPKYMVWASHSPDAWSLGGDLDLFARLIRARDKETLRAYAHKVIEEGFANWNGLERGIVTIALVQGEALGGGFEAALSSNLIIAERSARFGLPEILFSLFPGMGAYSYLSRRIAPALAERMILSGRIYTAEELYEMGVVDVLAEDGRGKEAIYAFVAKNRFKHAAHRAVFDARQRVNPVTLDELRDITDSWVETAMTLRDEDLRKMTRLVEAQNRRRARMAACA